MVRRFASLVLLFAVPAFSQTLHDVAKRVNDHYNRLSSLEAKYTERYTGMGMNRTESGTLLLRKPGKMRWSYAAPEGKLFVLDGKNAYFYTPGDAQAQKIPAKQLDDMRSPLRFLLGHTNLEKELDHLSMTTSGDRAIFTGVPKGMEDRVKAFTVTVMAEAGAIVGLKIEEQDGSITEFSFSSLKENVPTKDSDFVFTPPAGVEVVSGLPPV